MIKINNSDQDPTKARIQDLKEFLHWLYELFLRKQHKVDIYVFRNSESLLCFFPLNHSKLKTIQIVIISNELLILKVPDLSSGSSCGGLCGINISF